MKDFYDLIEGLRKEARISSKELAIRANTPVTTLASIMSRRPETLDRRTLDRIARVFGSKWDEILDLSEEQADRYAYYAKMRIPVTMSQESVERVYAKLVKKLDFSGTVRPIGRYHPNPNTTQASKIDVHTDWDSFKSSITLVLDKLNDDGLMEAMRRILDVANDPKYCKPKKEDDSWQKEKPPMGAEQSESAQTVDTRDEFPLE